MSHKKRIKEKKGQRNKLSSCLSLCLQTLSNLPSLARFPHKKPGFIQYQIKTSSPSFHSED
ncbi:hypothetical protein SAY87_011471 [Trapa incisa]|uniref:Uncharacterized protein n=1 Tax=Trapa incisa TaxID=236973 RepID=A0AAN7GN80_9MYRT|nr:hypothetical protein SAY87_011471 [Trapa incisa]